MMAERFHFTFGPVQEFVAQARRTRDLWAGSWLLSYLAENAIVAAERAGARIILPAREEGEREVVTMARGDRAERFGGVPNRFTAEASDPVAAARAAERGLRDAWQRIADAVWERFVEPVAPHGNGTREIWERQVASYWDISWVVGGARHLPARKNLRLVDARVEPGDHCTLMSELQELSGYVRARERAEQTEFWGRLRQQPGIGRLDLEENERLSAIALIKRLFVHVASEAVGVDLGEVRGWPSTAWLAASPWIERAMTSHAGAAAEFARSLDSLRWKWGPHGERGAARRRFGDREPQCFASLDGPLYFASTLANPASLDNLEEGQDTREPLKLLNALYEACGGGPEPFYAVLLMDGDRMGELLGRARSADSQRGEQEISGALRRFARKVNGVVEEKHGYTVYAGGDDVLALLPADTALACAIELESTYRAEFSGIPAVAGRALISGALVFAHYREPLRRVLRYAHHLLDDIAKERTGRGALAVGLVQSSGVGAEWSAPWEVVRGGAPGVSVPLRELAAGFGEGGRFNPTYLYNLRRTFARITDPESGKLGVDLPEDLIAAVAAAEYRRSRERQGDSSTRPDPDVVRRLMPLLRRWHRREGVVADPKSFHFDGVRVAAFLARMGVGAATGLEQERNDGRS